MENIIFNELKVRGYNVDVGVVVMNETDWAGKKVRKQLDLASDCSFLLRIDWFCLLGE